MNSKNIRPYLTAVLMVLVMASCNINKRYTRPNVADNKPYRFAGTDTNTLATTGWQQIYTDSYLQGLIQEGLGNNQNLKIAMARVIQAQAGVIQGKQAFVPTLTATPNYTVTIPSRAQAFTLAENRRAPTVHLYQITIASAWEADIWGKLSTAKRASIATLMQSESYRRAVQTQLVADIANNYYQLLALDAQLRIMRQTLEIRQKDVETMRSLKEAAYVTGADVVQSEANKYAVEVSIPDIMQSIRETEHNLSVLLGRQADSVGRGLFENQNAITDLKAGVPTQLLSYRPDVQQAEFGLIAAFELTNSARRYFYPSLNITATGGLGNRNLSHLISPYALYGSIITGLTQPILNQGLNRARLKRAQGVQEEALYTFRQSIINASREVSNALSSYEMAVAKSQARTGQIEALTKAVDYRKELLTYSSSTNFTDVLTSEQNLLSAQLSGINDKLQQLQAGVNLYRALGGGWK